MCVLLPIEIFIDIDIIEQQFDATEKFNIYYQVGVKVKVKVI